MMPQSDDELLRRVPDDGSRIGNTRLMRELGWSEDDFWETRNRLVDRGLLEIGRGRGGSVSRVILDKPSEPGVPGTEPPPAVNVDEATGARAPESELYGPVLQVLEEKWTKDKRVESAIVHLTAQQGRRATGGKWTRPDVTVATLSTYPYVPGRHFDIVTFEVKPCDAIDVTCVYEALAHLRSATKSYVMVHVPDDQSDSLADVLLEVLSEAKSHGIGVITFGTANDYETWEERVEPIRREPEPRKLNDFLATQFNQGQLERIVRWFR